MDANGEHQTRWLPIRFFQEASPAFSPDGTKLAFHGDLSSFGALYVTNLDGSNITQLTNSAGDASEIYLMNADGSNQVNLTNNTATEHHPAFSRDGSKIAFESNRDGNFEVYLMDVSGANPVNLTNNSAGDGSPSFSP
jgi:Tol biopolymer transport system component